MDGGGGLADRLVLGGNALLPNNDPSHYTTEKLRSEDGKPAAGLTTQELVPNDNGTVTLDVSARVRSNLAARDKNQELIKAEMQHPDRWRIWVGRMNAKDSDLSKAFRNAPWDRKTADAIKAFLDPGRNSPRSYYRAEIKDQKKDFDAPGKPHAVLAESYGPLD
jgi:hypothetical protein